MVLKAESSQLEQTEMTPQINIKTTLEEEKSDQDPFKSRQFFNT